MKRKPSEFCEASIGRHCLCSVKAGIDHEVHRCACGGEWASGGRVVTAPMYPATAGWGA